MRPGNRIAVAAEQPDVSLQQPGTCCGRTLRGSSLMFHCDRRDIRFRYDAADLDFFTLRLLMIRRNFQLLLPLGYPGLLVLSFVNYVVSVDSGSRAGELFIILCSLMLPVGILYCVVGWRISTRQKAASDLQDLTEFLFSFFGLIMVLLGTAFLPRVLHWFTPV